LYVLGSNNIYNTNKEKTVPIGEEKDAYTEWLNRQKSYFLERKDDIFASMKEDPKSIIFNISEKPGPIERATRSKNIGGRACQSYNESILNSFSEWLVGEPFPESVSTKKERCLYLDLLLRRAILQKKEGLFWIAPQVYSILDEFDNRKDLLKELK
jgi:hypothetical protein